MRTYQQIQKEWNSEITNKLHGDQKCKLASIKITKDPKTDKMM